MNVLVACEFSGVVRRAFRARGHVAYSCDLLPADDDQTYHLQGDALAWIATPPHGIVWDLLIAHPPCTYLASSGLHWNTRRPERAALTEAAILFVRALMAAPVKRKALENPIGCLSTKLRKPDQIIQPWQFGHDASKATCLWLDDLPALVPTDVLPGGRTARRANQTASGQKTGLRRHRCAGNCGPRRIPVSRTRWPNSGEGYREPESTQSGARAGVL